MSKLRVNKKIKKFFKKNKRRIVALTLSASLSTGLVYATMNKQININDKTSNNSSSKLNKEDLLKIKSDILDNIESIEVSINDNNDYHIIKTNYKETPIYDVNDDNQLYFKSVYIEYTGKEEYDISYYDAVYLGINELLNSKLKGYQKSKK